MKKLFLLFSLVIAFHSISQTLPAIPLKNGMAYYTFDHKLDNQKHCLSRYFDAPLSGQMILVLQEKIVNHANKLAIENKKNGVINYSFPLSRKLNYLNCNDTINPSRTRISIELQGELLWRPALIELFRKKVFRQEITAHIGFVFISKNEFKVIIKDIEYNVFWMKGLKEQGQDIYKLGEYFQNIKNQEKIKKDDIEFLNFIDNIIKSSDKLLLNALKDTYSTDEL